MPHRDTDITPGRLKTLEPLERRVLLSVTPFVATTTDLHDIEHGPFAKAGGNLANLYLNYRGAQRSGTLSAFNAATTLQTDAPGGSPLEVVGETVGVELVAVGSLPAFQASMQSLGMSVQSITPGDNAIAGFLPITLLSQVAQRTDVLHITPLDAPVVRQEGIANDQADQALQAASARSTYGLSGKGVKVGVISDSVNQIGNGLADSVATGDLPSGVQVISDGGAGDTDEGRAILEEIHDIAPDASLVFDSAGEGQQTMASAVAALQAAGCQVIIDDIGFADEPFFQPGILDRAIDAASAAGITYVTAAGNNGASGFEQAANFVAETDGNQLINFNPTGAAATRMNITVTDSGQLTLEWDDAYDGVTGTVHADLDIYLYDSNGTLRHSSTDDNFATGVPVEQLQVDPGTYQVQIVAKNTPTADLPRYYEFTGDFTMTTTQYAGTRTAIVGHAGFSNAISVGAVAFYDAPPFSSITPIPTEDFSSAGPVIESRDASGNLLPTALTIDKPDISATDGNNTSFFGTDISQDSDSLPNFFGTSSAAGNVAGVVALLKQAVPTASQSQILSALESTAIPVNGQAEGAYDPAAGFGLIDADAAVANLLTTAQPPAMPTKFTATAVSSSSIALGFDGDRNANGYSIQRSTSAKFKTAVARFELAAGSTGYTDTGLLPGTTYYYRIEAFNAAAASAFTGIISATTFVAGEVVLDNSASRYVTVTGAWTASTAVSGYYGGNYLQDDDAGHGTKSVKYRPNLPAAGEYFVYATWTRGADRATNVPFDVFSRVGQLLKTVRVNERSTGGNGPVLLGEFKLHSETPSFVRIRNTGTNGEVIADAIEFVPATTVQASGAHSVRAVARRDEAEMKLLRHDLD